MASILKLDQLQSDSGTVNLASNLAFTGAATFVGNIASPTITGTLNLIGGAIKFPSTQISSADGNTLDDYEEGTWTPTLGGVSGNPTVVYNTDYTSGWYQKIGRTVWVTFEMRFVSVSGGSGGILINGLPFGRADTLGPPINGPDGDRGSALDCYGVALASAAVWLNVSRNTTAISTGWNVSSSSPSGISCANMSGALYIRGSIQYMANS